MRISKKFVGGQCIGKQVFKRRGVGEVGRVFVEVSWERERFDIDLILYMML